MAERLHTPRKRPNGALATPAFLREFNGGVCNGRNAYVHAARHKQSRERPINNATKEQKRTAEIVSAKERGRYGLCSRFGNPTVAKTPEARGSQFHAPTASSASSSHRGLISLHHFMLGFQPRSYSGTLGQRKTQKVSFVLVGGGVVCCVPGRVLTVGVRVVVLGVWVVCLR